MMPRAVRVYCRRAASEYRVDVRHDERTRSGLREVTRYQYGGMVRAYRLAGCWYCSWCGAKVAVAW